jgi:hypothetical protein
MLVEWNDWIFLGKGPHDSPYHAGNNNYHGYSETGRWAGAGVCFLDTGYTNDAHTRDPTTLNWLSPEVYSPDICCISDGIRKRSPS